MYRSSLSSLATISDPTQLEHTLATWLGYLEKFWDDEGSHDSHNTVPTRLVCNPLWNISDEIYYPTVPSVYACRCQIYPPHGKTSM